MRVRLFAGVFLSLFSTIVFAQWELLPGLATDIGVGARGDGWWSVSIESKAAIPSTVGSAATGKLFRAAPYASMSIHKAIHGS